jgi:hypothetical protein
MTDELLTRALASYAAEPRSGLEQRVLHHVRLVAHRPRPARLLWAFAVVVLACALFLVLTRSAQKPEMARSVTRAPNPSPLAAAAPEVRPTPRPPARSLPRQTVFPVPVPLTEGERALIALVQRHPGIVAEAANREKRNAEAIEIEPLEIRPLRTESSQ